MRKAYRLLASVLSLALVTSLTPTVALATDQTTQSLQPSALTGQTTVKHPRLNLTLAEWAIDEYEVGVGNGDYNEGGSYYLDLCDIPYDKPPVQWCPPLLKTTSTIEWSSCFVMAGWKSCGLEEYMGAPDDFLNANSWLTWAKNNPDKGELIKNDENWIPRLGDICVDGEPDSIWSNYVGICCSDPDPLGQYRMIAGNDNNRVTERYMYPGQEWTWIFRPNYEPPFRYTDLNDDIDYSVTAQEFISAWAPAIEKWFKSWDGTSWGDSCPLAAYSTKLAQSAYRYKVDPRLSPMVSRLETSGGKGSFDSDPYNAWPFSYGSSSWNSWEEAIDAYEEMLKGSGSASLTISEFVNRYYAENDRLGGLENLNEFKESFREWIEKFDVETSEPPSDDPAPQEPELTSISSATVTGFDTKTYTGRALAPSPVVKLGTSTLALGVDYTVTFKSAATLQELTSSEVKSAGEYKVVVTGKGSYEGSIEKAYTVLPAQASDMTISGLSAKTYSGAAFMPTPVVKYAGITLKAGTDYTMTHSANANAGTATVTITGIGNFTGKTTANYTIKPASMTYVTVSTVKNKTYTGKAFKPSPTVKYQGVTLKAGTDYTVSYANNIKAGLATVTLTGKGNFTGTKALRFSIAKAPASKFKVAKIANKKYKKGKAIKPSPTVKFNGKKLKKGTDYVLTYSNNTKRGTAKITVRGIGNFTGSKTVKFKIK